MVTTEIITTQPERILDWTIATYGSISMGIVGLVSATFSDEKCWGIPGLIVKKIKWWRK